MAQASESDKDRLLATIMAGLPGAYDRYDVPGLLRFMSAHEQRHQSQIADIVSDPQFPRTLSAVR